MGSSQGTSGRRDASGAAPSPSGSPIPEGSTRRKHDIAALVTGLAGPVNGNPGEELDLATLRELGVARVSYGSRFYRAAMAALRTAVRELAPNQ